MSGRIEKDNLIEKKIKLKIQNESKILSGYSQSFGNKTSNTKKVYIGHVINFCRYLKNECNIDVDNKHNIKDLNYYHITSYMNYISTYTPNGKHINKEAGTCATEFYAIKHFCKYLKLCRYIDFNPCDEVEVPKDKKIHKIVSLSSEEIAIIKNNIKCGVGNNRSKGKQKNWKNRDLCIVSLGVTTGLRVSAISNIDISDINFEEKTLKTIEKGGYERIIYLSDKLLEIINNWIQDRESLLNDDYCNALFISARKQRISINAISNIIKKYTYNIDKKITPHKLRSTAATNLYDATGDIYLVADVLGHHNIQNTKRYAAVSNSRKQYAADTLSKLI
jgi:integrase/recombinase XerC